MCSPTPFRTSVIPGLINPSHLGFLLTPIAWLGPVVPSRPSRRKHALFVLVLVLASLAGRSQIYAVDSSDTFYGNSAGNPSTIGIQDSAFGTEALLDNTTGTDNTA